MLQVCKYKSGQSLIYFRTGYICYFPILVPRSVPKVHHLSSFQHCASEKVRFWRERVGKAGNYEAEDVGG